MTGIANRALEYDGCKFSMTLLDKERVDLRILKHYNRDRIVEKK